MKSQSDKGRIRVGVLTGGVPHPTHGASTVLFFLYIQALCAAGFDVFCACILREGNPGGQSVDAFKQSLSRYGSFSAEAFELPRILEAFRLRIIDRRDAGEALRQRVRQFAPDALVCFDLEAAALAKDIRGLPKIVWLGDLAFDSYWYNFAYGVKESFRTIRSLPYALAQRWGWMRAYREILSDYSDIVVSSKSSEGKLLSLGLPSHYEPYPWPAPAESATGDEAAEPAKPRFFFFGTLVGLGSRSSFHFIFDKLYPLLIERWGAGGFEILIAGREMLPDWVMKKIRTRLEFRYVGFVDDLAPLVRDCHAVIAPLDVPVGNRSRILTAMALKALVIAHQNAALGNPDLVHEKNCLLAQSANEFASAMSRSVDDWVGLRSVALCGFQTYIDLFSPDAAAPLFTSMVKNRLRRE